MKEKTFVGHLEELRRRLISFLIVLGILSIAAFSFSEKFLAYVLKVVGETIFLSPAEGFLVHIKISVLVAFLVSLPLFFYEAWAFIAGALKTKERRFIKFFCVASFLLFACGAIFAYFVILPIAINFLLSYQSPVMQAKLSVNQYFGFLCTLLISFGFIFELPLLIVFLTKLNIIGPGFLIQNRKFAFLLIFIVAAILTPPDVITQVLMALPLLFLYEAGIILSRAVTRKRVFR